MEKLRLDEKLMLKRKELLQIIKYWWGQHKSPPSLRDLANVTNSSVSNISFHIDIMREEGMLYTKDEIDSTAIVPKDISISFEEDK